MAGVFCLGLFIAFYAKHNATGAIVTFVLTFAFVMAGIVAMGLEEESSATADEPVTPVAQQPAVQQRRQEVPRASEMLGNGLIQAQALAGVAGEMLMDAAVATAAAHKSNPARWWTLFVAAVTALVTFVTMMGWLSAIPGYHLVGALALVTIWLIARQSESWTEAKAILDNNKVAVWLVVFIVLAIVGVMHAWLCFGTNNHKRWFAWAAFAAVSALSALIAFVTHYEKWGKAGAFTAKWLFTEGKVSLLIWLGLLVGILFAILVPAARFDKFLAGIAGMGIMYMLGLIAFMVIGLVIFWRKP